MPQTAVDPSLSATPSFPVVALGASAGGLSAFEAFFSALPREVASGMAFVLVQHLAPDHESLLVEILGRQTTLEVVEVEDGMPIRPDRVHVIPPGRTMEILDGVFQLREAPTPRGLRLPIDVFFRSLAREAGKRAIGIVLSGNGSDGTIGLRAIQDEGGMTLAQTPASAEYDSMPRSAIEAGAVDHVAPAGELPALLTTWSHHLRPRSGQTEATDASVSEVTLRRICLLLRAQSGHDFSQYKPGTLVRRIERRMALQGIDGTEAYLQCLDQDSAEVATLFRDILIGVTAFFRDPDAFRDLEQQVVPGLFEGKSPGEPVRVWVAGCSTGEEAYSIAILLGEHLDTLLPRRHPVQVFATDIDPRAIASARTGLFPASIAQDLSPERLTRHFTLEADGRHYRVAKRIRDLLVFSEHDLVLDPPFSRLDLVSCRNLMIYFDADLQRRVLPLFHYALQPGGFLFLGSSESVGDDLFETRVRSSRIFVRRADSRSGPTVGSKPRPGSFLSASAAARPPAAAGRPPLREFAEQALLKHSTPPGALVDAQGDILYLHGRTGAFLEPAPGECGPSNILRMAREGLRTELVTGLRKAGSTRGPVRFPGLGVASGESVHALDLHIVPLGQNPENAEVRPLFLVSFEEARVVDPFLSGHAGMDADERIAALDLELRAKEDVLRSANDELRSANEGMQSANEELQSSNEELETSKEELQSLNEEFATVNAELQARVAELSRANNDMNNLLAGTGIGTIFVDHDLKVLRFTPAATRIVNLIPGDVGRPIAHLVSNLVGYDGMVADARAVLTTLVPREIEVRSREGDWYAMRLLPYRTLENVVEGVVIAFLDISDAKRREDDLRKARELEPLAAVVRDARDAIVVHDRQGRILAWNPGAERLYGWTPTQALRMGLADRVPAGSAAQALDEVFSKAGAAPFPAARLTRGGGPMDVSCHSVAMLDAAGAVYAVALTERARDATSSCEGVSP